MVLPVDVDARGIVAPDAGLTRFRLDRFAPSPPVARFVDRYWATSWHLPDGESYTQRVFAHPVVNVVFMPQLPPSVHGVTTRVGEQTLIGQGWALGVMFWPGGFRPFVDCPLSRLTDRAVPFDDLFPGGDLAERIAAATSAAAQAQIADEFLARAIPDTAHPCEETIRRVERVASQPAFVRVEKLAAESGYSVRQLQRRFADHVGLSPKTVIRRYRLYDAAERVRDGQTVAWSAVAAELGYADQAHLTRDFTQAFGSSPERYARFCARPARPDQS